MTCPLHSALSSSSTVPTSTAQSQQCPPHRPPPRSYVKTRRALPLFVLTVLHAFQRVNSAAEPYAHLPSICTQLIEAKARKGLSFEDIGKAIGRDEVWVAAAFYAQVRPRKARSGFAAADSAG